MVRFLKCVFPGAIKSGGALFLAFGRMCWGKVGLACKSQASALVLLRPRCATERCAGFSWFARNSPIICPTGAQFEGAPLVVSLRNQACVALRVLLAPRWLDGGFGAFASVRVCACAWCSWCVPVRGGGAVAGVVGM